VQHIYITLYRPYVAEFIMAGQGSIHNRLRATTLEMNQLTTLMVTKRCSWHCYTEPF